MVRVDSPPSDCMTTEEAASVLLGLGQHYDAAANAHLATYDPSPISVPVVGSNPVDLASQLPDDARKFLGHFDEHILRNDDDWGHTVEQNAPVKCHTDPKLRFSKKSYYNFVRCLYAAGLLGFRARAKSKVGLFFVKKRMANNAWLLTAEQPGNSSCRVLTSRWAQGPRGQRSVLMKVRTCGSLFQTLRTISMRVVYPPSWATTLASRTSRAGWFVNFVKAVPPSLIVAPDRMNVMDVGLPLTESCSRRAGVNRDHRRVPDSP